MKFLKINAKESPSHNILLINNKIDKIFKNSNIRSGDFKDFYEKIDTLSRESSMKDSLLMDSGIKDHSRIDSSRINSSKMDNVRKDYRKNSIRMDSALIKKSSTIWSGEDIDEISQIKMSNFRPSNSINIKIAID